MLLWKNLDLLSFEFRLRLSWSGLGLQAGRFPPLAHGLEKAVNSEWFTVAKARLVDSWAQLKLPLTILIRHELGGAWCVTFSVNEREKERTCGIKCMYMKEMKECVLAWEKELCMCACTRECEHVSVCVHASIEVGCMVKWGMPV